MLVDEPVSPGTPDSSHNYSLQHPISCCPYNCSERNMGARKPPITLYVARSELYILKGDLSDVSLLKLIKHIDNIHAHYSAPIHYHRWLQLVKQLGNWTSALKLSIPRILTIYTIDNQSPALQKTHQLLERTTGHKLHLARKPSNLTRFFHCIIDLL